MCKDLKKTIIARSGRRDDQVVCIRKAVLEHFLLPEGARYTWGLSQELWVLDIYSFLVIAATLIPQLFKRATWSNIRLRRGVTTKAMCGAFPGSICKLFQKAMLCNIVICHRGYNHINYDSTILYFIFLFGCIHQWQCVANICNFFQGKAMYM